MRLEGGEEGGGGGGASKRGIALGRLDVLRGCVAYNDA